MKRTLTSVLVAISFAAATLAVTTVSASAVEGCSSGCHVGGHGNGGAQSDGKAKGSHDGNVTFPEHPGEVIDNSGTDHSGHIAVTDEATGTSIGSSSGGYARGIDDFVGHSTGVFGTCNGRSSKC